MPWDHVAFEVEEHLRVGSLVAVGEEGGVVREEGFGHEEEGDDEADAGADCAEVVVPLPAGFLAEKSSNWVVLGFVGRNGRWGSNILKAATWAPFVTKIE